VFTSGPAIGGALRDAFGASAPIFLGSAFYIAILPLLVLLRFLEAPQRASAGA
jgi:hypothetical protein